jgi:hypothetical protein
MALIKIKIGRKNSHKCFKDYIHVHVICLLNSSIYSMKIYQTHVVYSIPLKTLKTNHAPYWSRRWWRNLVYFSAKWMFRNKIYKYINQDLILGKNWIGVSLFCVFGIEYFFSFHAKFQYVQLNALKVNVYMHR